MTWKYEVAQVYYVVAKDKETQRSKFVCKCFDEEHADLIRQLLEEYALLTQKQLSGDQG